jgi:hypothetical protein
MSDKKGKPKKPVQRLTVEQFVNKKGTFTGSADNDEIRINTGRHCVHHETVLLDTDNKANSMLIGIPAMQTHHITRKRDETSKRVSMKTFVPIYGNWPLGKKRGEDPRGDLLLDMLEGMHTDYCDSLDANPSIKKKLFMASDQSCAMNAPAASVVASPVLWEKYPASHDLAGDINPNKSPEFKVMLWDIDVRVAPDPNPTEIGPDDLLFDEGNKKSLTAVTDDREKKAIRVKKEDHLNEFAYEAGDYKKGKFPFMLFQQMRIISPTVYWESKRPAVFQIKASYMWIREKIMGDSPDSITPDERAEMDREAEEAAAYYGIKKRPVHDVQSKSDGYVRDSELEDSRDSKKQHLSVEEMEFERNLREAELQHV